MNTSQEHVIQFSRKKILSIIRLQVFLIVVFSFGLYGSIVELSPRLASFKIVGFLLIIIIVLALLSALRHLNSHSPGLVINSCGIINNTTMYSVDTIISWEDITNVRIIKARSTRWLSIETFDSQKYYSDNNIFIRSLQVLNRTFFGSSIQISADMLEINFDEMADLVERYYEKCSRKASISTADQ